MDTYNIDACPKVICCDYYMTLVELHRPYARLGDWITQYLKENHPPVAADKFLRKFTRHRAVLTAGQEFRLGIDILTQSLDMSCRDFNVPSFTGKFTKTVEDIFVSPSAYPDAWVFLEDMKKECPVGLLTNADNYILEQSIARQGFTFDFIISSENARCYKPNPGIFDYALDYLGIRKHEMVMLGDSQTEDINGAGLSGIQTVWLNRNGDKLIDGVTPPALEVPSLIDAIGPLKQMRRMKTSLCYE